MLAPEPACTEHLQTPLRVRDQTAGKGQGQSGTESGDLQGNPCLTNAKVPFISVATSAPSALRCPGLVQTQPWSRSHGNISGIAANLQTGS